MAEGCRRRRGSRRWRNSGCPTSGARRSTEFTFRTSNEACVSMPAPLRRGKERSSSGIEERLQTVEACSRPSDAGGVTRLDMDLDQAIDAVARQFSVT